MVMVAGPGDESTTVNFQMNEHHTAALASYLNSRVDASTAYHTDLRLQPECYFPYHTMWSVALRPDVTPPLVRCRMAAMPSANSKASAAFVFAFVKQYGVQLSQV